MVKVADWPASKIVRRKVADLMPYAQNARTHSDEQIDQIVASIAKWGWTVPILVDEEGMILAGHGRVMAAERLGLKEVPAMVARGWDEAAKRAYILADNQLALNAGWDEALLKVELSEIQALDFDLSLTGFSDDELARILDAAASGAGGENSAGSLADKFGMVPFSVMSARDGWWQERKRAWISLGIQSELGRGDVESGKGIPSGSRMPGVDPKTGKIVRTDSKARPLSGVTR